MRQRWVWAAVVMICASTSLLLGKPGTVTTRDDNTFQGDVTEDSSAGTVTINVNGVPVIIKSANVKSIVYVEQVDASVRQRLATLGAKDVPARLALAKYAIGQQALLAARDVLLDAQKIDPQNAEVNNLLARVKEAIEPASTRPVAASTEPAVAKAPPETPAEPATPMIIRQVTPNEINFIRQSELVPQDTVRVRLDGTVRHDFADYTGVSFSDFDRLPLIEQAFQILDRGKPSMKQQVKILSDPAALSTFRRMVNRTVVAGCAASKCHGGSGPAAFRLFPQETDAAAYSNFIILVKGSMAEGGRQIPMIDRQNPDQSLLLAYLLPAALSDHPHPETKNYHGTVRNRADSRYAAVLTWVRDDLKPLAPDYSNINLTQPPTTQPTDR